jgi:hypothetical protein
MLRLHLDRVTTPCDILCDVTPRRCHTPCHGLLERLGAKPALADTHAFPAELGALASSTATLSKR